MTHEHGQSDSAIVAVKPTNKAGRPAAEPVEPRAGTKGNVDEQSTRRAQNREGVTRAPARIRQAARQREKERFHHAPPPRKAPTHRPWQPQLLWNDWAPTAMVDMPCHENGIEHRLTRSKHPWMNGQVERMNRTIEEAAVKRYPYNGHRQVQGHLTDFINAYNYGRRLKTLRGLMPTNSSSKCGQKSRNDFKLNPTHQMPGPNRRLAITRRRAVLSSLRLSIRGNMIRRLVYPFDPATFPGEVRRCFRHF